jgi:hypothetical protein
VSPLRPIREEPDRLFDNADSFAMAFDQAWQRRRLDPSRSRAAAGSAADEEPLEEVLAELIHHPFLQGSPDMARDVARFRIRLHRSAADGRFR